MEDQKLIDRAASFLGWKKEFIFNRDGIKLPPGSYYWRVSEYNCRDASGFDPLVRIGDAMLLAEKAGSIPLSSEGAYAEDMVLEWYRWKDNNGTMLLSVPNKEAARRLTRAILSIFNVSNRQPEYHGRPIC